MDIQALADAMNRAAEDTRGDYHLTLGKAVKAAKQATGNVKYLDGGAPGKERCYRGYYSDLSFEDAPGEISAADFSEQCEAAIGTTYQGYKGGDFTMHGKTPLWRAEWGSCGRPILRAMIEGGDLILVCGDEE